ncbi:hypothetical protein AHiyo4_25240 [Arthrobacter sp. Hiyo4]|nr:hypothetical protein AHiyo4_25240 [Arthrobacter sp. Hiyo4]
MAGVWLTLWRWWAVLLFGAVATCLLIRASRGRGRVAGRRSFLMTTAVALLLAATAAAHSAVSSSQRHDGPLAEAVAVGNSVVAVLEVTGSPRAMTVPGTSGPPQRWSVTAQTEQVTVSSRVIRTRAPVVVVGGRAGETWCPASWSGPPAS